MVLLGVVWASATRQGEGLLLVHVGSAHGRVLSLVVAVVERGAEVDGWKHMDNRV